MSPTSSPVHEVATLEKLGRHRCAVVVCGSRWQSSRARGELLAAAVVAGSWSPITAAVMVTLPSSCSRQRR